MPYDHHLKAGNQGDCVKHPALIAALDAASNARGQSHTMFHYLDLFAGHAWHPLLDGNDYEWRNGIGQLASTRLSDDAADSVKTWWNLWHAAPEWPTMTPAGYPGSAWIAAHLCREAKRPVKLELYDRSEEVRRDLERAFPASHAIQDANCNICLIGQSLDPTKVKEEHVKAADFVFIDPPGWRSKKHPEYPRWEDILEHVLKPRDQPKRTLMWMPAGGHERTKNQKDSEKVNSGAFPWDDNSNGGQRKKCEQVCHAGYSWSAVRWEKNSYSGCILVYNCAAEAIRKAIEFIATAMKWKSFRARQAFRRGATRRLLNFFWPASGVGKSGCGEFLPEK